jgi:DNA (cytosine-5)-methyltransferase 1
MDGMCPTITTRASGGHETKIMDNRPIVRIAEATKKGYAEATIGDSINIAYPNSNTRRGRVCEGKANTLSTSPQQAVITEDSNMENIRIRKLTPRECWRLMGFDDEDFNKARTVCSDTQLYKQAGNSIVVNVLEAIMGNMFRNDYISQ